MRYRLVALSMLALTFLPSTTFADSALQYRLKGRGALQKILVKEGRVLIPGLDADSRRDFLFDRERGQAAVIDHGAQTFVTVDDKAIERLRRQSEPLQPLLAGLGAQLKNLTPEQRAKWQSMLGGIDLERVANAAKNQAPAHLARGSRHEKVGAFECERVTLLSGSKKLAEVCVSQADSLGLPEEDYVTLRSLFGFAQSMAAKSQGLSGLLGWSIPVIQVDEIPGVPVEIRGFNKMKNESLSLASVDTSKTGDNQSMAIPSGYRHEPLKLW